MLVVNFCFFSPQKTRDMVCAGRGYAESQDSLAELLHNSVLTVMVRAAFFSAVDGHHCRAGSKEDGFSKASQT